jgi:hypothetical protein
MGKQGQAERAVAADRAGITAFRGVVSLRPARRLNLGIRGRRTYRVATAAQHGLWFVPSAVEGLPAVTEVAVFPDRLELLSEGKWVVIRFLDIARWYRRGWLYRPLARLGLGVRGWPSVADRDWFHPPAARFFRFFTQPPLTVYMPDEPPETSYGQTMFRRVQDVLAEGGFGTFDLG